MNKKTIINATILSAFIATSTAMVYRHSQDIHNQKIVLEGAEGKKFLAKTEKSLTLQDKLLLRSYILTQKAEGTYKDGEVTIDEAISKARTSTEEEKMKIGKKVNGMDAGDRLGYAVTHQEGALPKRCSRGMREAGFCTDK